jgi:hypothetical protein
MALYNQAHFALFDCSPEQQKAEEQDLEKKKLGGLIVLHEAPALLEPFPAYLSPRSISLKMQQDEKSILENTKTSVSLETDRKHQEEKHGASTSDKTKHQVKPNLIETPSRRCTRSSAAKTPSGSNSVPARSLEFGEEEKRNPVTAEDIRKSLVDRMRRSKEQQIRSVRMKRARSKPVLEKLIGSENVSILNWQVGKPSHS